MSGTMHCPVCDSTNLTQEGLSALRIALGFWRCLDCGAIRRPLIQPNKAAQGQEE